MKLIAMTRVPRLRRDSRRIACLQTLVADGTGFLKHAVCIINALQRKANWRPQAAVDRWVRKMHQRPLPRQLLRH